MGSLTSNSLTSVSQRCSRFPAVVREKALAVGAQAWIDELPALIGAIEADWGVSVGRLYADSTEACGREATRADGSPAVLKLIVPRDGDAAAHEATVLRLAAGEGCPRLFQEDVARGALLIERLGRSLYEFGCRFDAVTRSSFPRRSANLAPCGRRRLTHGGGQGTMAG